MPIFNIWPEIILGLSLRSDGSMKNNFVGQNNFLKNLGLGSRIVAQADLIHQNQAVAVDNITNNLIIKNCDAIVSSQFNILLSLTVADCLPIYFYDSKQGVIGLAHAGWRGLIAGVINQTLKIFFEKYNSSPNDIKVFIGPHIQSCHFEVQKDIINFFDSRFILKRENRFWVDLSQLAQSKLIEAGLLDDNIQISSECTYCLSDKYSSYRREKSTGLKTMLAFISFKL